VSAQTNRNGEFLIQDAPPGEYDVSLDPLPAGSYVGGIRYAGRDTVFGSLRLDTDWALTTQSIQVVLSFSGGLVDGRVSDRKGDPATSVQVVLIPETRFRRQLDRFLAVSTDESGYFELAGVPPGRYTALAFEQIEPGRYFDDEFIGRIAEQGLPITSAKGSHQTIMLRLIPREDAGVRR
jgi:hypothetical protein